MIPHYDNKMTATPSLAQINGNMQLRSKGYHKYKCC